MAKTMMTVCGLLLFMLLLDSMEMLTPTNVARFKPTSQSGIFNDDWYSNRAVNGEFQVVDDYTSCTATSSSNNSWWIVDLLHHFNISYIGIQNRVAFSERLTDFYVYVSGSNPVPKLSNNQPEAGDLCLHYPGTLPNGIIQKLECAASGVNLHGRYVYVWKPAHQLLTLCEFEVWAYVGATRIEVATSHMMHRGMRGVLSSPRYSKVLSMRSPAASARQLCCQTCMSTARTGMEATHFQVNEQRGLCECVQHSDFSPDPSLQPMVGWDVWAMRVVVG